MKPNTLDTSQVFYADRGGYTMRRAIKEQWENEDTKLLLAAQNPAKILMTVTTV